MTNTIIPQVWSVGIDKIDQEHQELLDLLYADESETNLKFFDEFYDRFAALSTRREEFLKDAGYNNLNYIAESKKRTLITLKQIYRDIPQSTIEVCRDALLKEIADADLYYNEIAY